MSKELRIDLSKAYGSISINLPGDETEADIARIDVYCSQGKIQFKNGSVLQFTGAYECTRKELLDLVRDLRNIIWEMVDSTGYEADATDAEVIRRANTAIDPYWEDKDGG